MTVGDETRTLGAGEAIFKPRGVHHTRAGFEGHFRAIGERVRATGAVDRDEAARLMAGHGLRPAGG